MSFHVAQLHRITTGPVGSDASYGHNGAFMVPSFGGWFLFLIASDGTDADAAGALGAWEHVSVSVRGQNRVRTPTWEEMCLVKRHCWDPDDVVVQYHPAEADYVNLHPHVLHLWKWKRGVFPLPPREAV